MFVKLRRRPGDEPTEVNMLKEEYRQTPVIDLKRGVMLHLLPRDLRQQPIKRMSKQSWSTRKTALLAIVPPVYHSEPIPPR